MICLPAMTGKDTAARIHGTVLSILLARAISMAPADHGLVKRSDGLGAAGDPGVRLAGVSGFCSSDGVRSGDENDSRYSAMKKSSFSAQKVKRTFCELAIPR